jgi:hypothetical protein
MQFIERAAEVTPDGSRFAKKVWLAPYFFGVLMVSTVVVAGRL